MTPLHWASYHGDSKLVQILLKYGARQTLTKKGNSAHTPCYPVDIAGSCGHEKVVKVFCWNVEDEIVKKLK